MKNLLPLALPLVVLSTLASAATVSCTVTSGGLVSGYATSTADINGNFANTGARITQGGPLATTGVFTCPVIGTIAGPTITSYQVFVTGDYTGGPFGTTSGTTVNLGYIALGGVVNTSTVSLAVSGGNSSNSTVPPVPTQLGSTFGGQSLYGGFTVDLSSNVASGTVGASSAQVVIVYTTAATPEPATMGLVGSALLGLGFLARKRK